MGTARSSVHLPTLRPLAVNRSRPTLCPHDLVRSQDSAEPREIRFESDPARLAELEAMPQEPIDPTQVSAEDKVLRDQQHRNLRVCLSQLPERNRKISPA